MTIRLTWTSNATKETFSMDYMNTQNTTLYAAADLNIILFSTNTV